MFVEAILLIEGNRRGVLNEKGVNGEKQVGLYFRKSKTVEKARSKGIVREDTGHFEFTSNLRKEDN